jgi:hypothetical protein
MKDSRLNQALAIGNLVNLGHDLPRATDIALDWAERQQRQSIEHVARLAREALVEDRLPIDQGQQHLFASFHYSAYPLLYRTLAHRSPTKVVHGLIGEQEQGHRDTLNQQAAAFGFRIEFIESGPRMVRHLRNALRDGSPGMLLIDIPWSRSASEMDVRYKVPGGAFRGRSSLERLVRLIDDEYQFITAARRGEGLAFDAHGPLSFDRAFGLLGQALRDDPADYERLHQLHRFFEFDAPGSCVVSFEVAGRRYALHGRTMNAWQIDGVGATPTDAAARERIVTDSSMTARFKKIVNDDVDAVLFL